MNKFNLLKDNVLLIPKDSVNFDIQNGVIVHNVIVQGIMVLVLNV